MGFPNVEIALVDDAVAIAVGTAVWRYAADEHLAPDDVVASIDGAVAVVVAEHRETADRRIHIRLNLDLGECRVVDAYFVDESGKVLAIDAVAADLQGVGRCGD